MYTDYVALKKAIVGYLNLSGFSTSQQVNDYWLAIAKALIGLEGEGTLDHRLLVHRDAITQHPALSINTDVTNFNHNLSSADTDVQKALDTLDNLVIPVPPSSSSLSPLSDILGGVVGTTGIYAREGHRHNLNISPTALPLPDGIAAVGNGGTYADIYHVHPLTNSTQEATKLYPALIPDPLLRPPASSLVYFESPFTDLGGPGLDFSAWTQIAGVSTWQYNYVGAVIFVGVAGGGSAIPMEEGARFVVTNDLDPGRPDPATSPFLGIYELYHQATSTTAAIIRRVQDANTSAGLTNGMVVEVTDPAGIGNAGFYTLDATDPVSVDISPLQFDGPSSYTPNPTYKLLTGAQLISEGADNTSTLYTWAVASSLPSEDPFLGPFLTILGTPGVSTLPAGPYSVQLEGVTINGLGSTGQTATVQATLIDVDNGHSILTAYSPPLVQSVTPTNVAFQANLAAPYAFSPTFRLALSFNLVSTAPMPGMEVIFKYSSPTRGTWIQLPLSTQIIGSGTVSPASLYLNETVFALDGASLKSKAVIGSLGHRTEVIPFAHGVTSGASTTFLVPADSTGGPLTVRPIWAPSVTAVGTYSAVWQIDVKSIVGTDITSAGTITSWTGNSSTCTINQSILETGISTPSFVANTLLRLELQRLGANGSDTYTGNANLVGVQVDYIKKNT